MWVRVVVERRNRSVGGNEWAEREEQRILSVEWDRRIRSVWIVYKGVWNPSQRIE